jgi:very-short-patch-repair endonuclease
MYDELAQRGYWVTPQVRVGQYRIDMVVEGHNDARLAVECDGDKYHGADKWADDMQRQRVLERAGWVFWRCFASAFIRRRREVMDDLLKTLADRGIEPTGAEGAPRSVHTERRLVSIVTEPVKQGDLKPVEVAATAQASPPAVRPTPSSSARDEVPRACQEFCV